MKSILVIAPQFIGDSVLTIPFLRELKKHVGRCEIDVISKNAGCFIFSKCPYVRKVYDFNKLSVAELRQNKYDKAYVLKRSLSAALLALRLGIKDTIGFDGQFRHLILKRTVKYNRFEYKHELEHMLDVLRADYVEINNKNLEFYVDETKFESIKNYLSSRKRALVVACSSTYVKDWNIENFAKSIEFLQKNDYDIYFVGLGKERDYYEKISYLLENSNVKNLCGLLNLDEIVALISQMDIVFGVDSGFCHLASALGKKCVTLFGPTSIFQWQPIGANVISLGMMCSPCVKPKKCKKNFACMQNITSDMAIEELKKVL